MLVYVKLKFSLTLAVLFFFLCICTTTGNADTINNAIPNFIQISHHELPFPSPDIPGAINNVILSAQLVNGVIINPGDTFSFNDVVGPRTLARGFAWSESISWTGKKYDRIRDVGGGVCRTATAIHQAAKKVGLKIVERHNHSIPVEYAVPGEDAAVWYGTWDYRFQNNQEMPIRIVTSTETGEVDVLIEMENTFTVFADNKPVALNAIPYIDNQQLMVPIRSVAESLKINVSWDQRTQRLTLKKDNCIIELTSTSDVAYINGTPNEMTIPPTIKNAIMFLSAKFLGENFGYKVVWDDITNKISYLSIPNSSEEIITEKM